MGDRLPQIFGWAKLTSIIGLLLFFAAPQSAPAQNAPQAVNEPLSCADKSIVAGAVRTQEDVRAFVQCAYEFVQEVGFEEARRTFHEDARWKSGPHLCLRRRSDAGDR